jgi:hypothetical protein
MVGALARRRHRSARLSRVSMKNALCVCRARLFTRANARQMEKKLGALKPIWQVGAGEALPPAAAEPTPAPAADKSSDAAPLSPKAKKEKKKK